MLKSLTALSRPATLSTVINSPGGSMAEEALGEAARRLEARGHRATPQRMAVLAALLAQRTFVTAQEMHGVLRRVQPHLGLATVYRTLELLVQCGLAEAFPQPNKEVR